MDTIARAPANSDTVLTRFRAALNKEFGDRIDRVVLYGSRSRGDARPDSDYDVAVFFRGIVDFWREVERLSVLETALFDETGAFMHAMPFEAGTWKERSPMMGAIRREGIDI